MTTAPIEPVLDLDHSWAVVDVETSGFQPDTGRVLSVAALALDAAGRPEQRFHTLVDAGVDPGPVHIHGLTRERLAGAPSFAQIAPELLDMLEGRILVAHNAAFDHRFLAAEVERTGRKLPVERRLCTLALSRRLGLAVPDHKLGTLAGYWGRTSEARTRRTRRRRGARSHPHPQPAARRPARPPAPPRRLRRQGRSQLRSRAAHHAAVLVAQPRPAPARRSARAGDAHRGHRSGERAPRATRRATRRSRARRRPLGEPSDQRTRHQQRAVPHPQGRAGPAPRASRSSTRPHCDACSPTSGPASR